MSQRPYVIRPGSRVERLLQAMAIAPEHFEMNSTEIGALTDTPVTGVCVMLKTPVQAGLLHTRHEGHRVMYAITPAGRAAAAGLPPPPAAPAAKPAEPVARKPEAAAPAGPAAPAASAAPVVADDFTVALYNDGEMYLHGVRIDEHNGVLLTAAQAAELREYLLHTGSFIEYHQSRSSV